MKDPNPKLNTSHSMGNNTALEIYSQELEKYPLLSKEEEYSTAVAMRAGDESAREKLIQANLRFVISVARHYSRNWIPLEDLISAGNMGLVRAAQDYDPERGLKFISYAVGWIRAYIRQAIAEGRCVRLPPKVLLTAIRLSILEDIHPQWTQGQFARELGITIEQVRELRQQNEPMLSLENNPAGGNYVRQTPDPDATPADREVMRSALREILDEAMDKQLTKAEKYILTRYYGLDGEPPQVASDLCKTLGLTKTRVLMARRNALNKLRGPEYEELLRAFLEETP